jgi:hypothetical protein
MLKFYNIFKKDDATITINNKTYQKKDCKRLATGYEKTIYELKGTDHCFFIPSKDILWNGLIENEKRLCDNILSLGLKAQQYKITPLTVSDKNGNSSTINVLWAPTFESLTKSGNLAIFNKKEMSESRFIGRDFNFYNNDKALLNNRKWNQRIIGTLLKDYAVCLAFKLPIIAVSVSIDDSEHFSFDLKDKEAPVARYMFWDVEDVSKGALPVVPTLQVLKEGLDIQNKDAKKRPFANRYGIKKVVREVSSTMTFKSDEILKMGFQDSMEACCAIDKALYESITKEMYNDALQEARNQVIKRLPILISNFKAEAKKLPLLEKHKLIIDYLKTAVSTDSFQAVKDVLELIQDPKTITENNCQDILNFAKKYKNTTILEYLIKYFDLKNKTGIKNEIAPLKKSKNDAGLTLENKTKETAPIQSISPKVNSSNWLIYCLAATTVNTMLLLWGFSMAMSIAGAIATLTTIVIWRNLRENYANHHMNSALLTDQVNLNKEYFEKGYKAESSWGAYLESFMSPITYLPFLQASRSFQVGRASYHETEDKVARLKVKIVKIK